jgi:hypothetical protein
LSFEHSSVVPDGHPNLRMVVCTPENAATRRAVAQVNAELAKAEESGTSTTALHSA